MDNTNKTTLNSYESGIAQYIQNAPNKRGGVVEQWIDESIKDLPLDAAILEIGSAYGRDAKIIEEKGYKVEKTDATKGFVDILQKDDPSARELNILTDQLYSRYDLIIANAVFLHFTVEEFRQATSKVYDALNQDGVFSITLKEGQGDAWQSNKGMAPRYFQFWSKEEVVQTLESIGFTNINAWVDASDGSGTTWIMVIAKKP